MKRKSVLLRVVFMLVFMIAVSTLPVFAVSTDEVPYESYTYWESTSDKKAVYTRAVYQPDFVIDAEYLGVTTFAKLSDVCSDKHGNIYMLDGGASKLYVLDSEYQLKNVINEVTGGEEPMNFFEAKGVFVGDDGSIYISDTKNARVLQVKENGQLVRKYTLPNSELIPDGFIFQPTKTLVDSRGYIYILSDGSYYGAILYSPEYEFLGFYGSNEIGGNILTAIQTIWNRLFMTNEKYEASESKLPFQITDLYLDSIGFVYTTTGKTEINSLQKGQIRRFNPGGISVRNTNSKNFADVSLSTVSGKIKSQDLLGIALDKNDFIYAVDSVYGRVFMYDKEFNLISAFGGGMGKGKQVGTFVLPCAIEVNGDDILVCDSEKKSVTVFRITEYGKLVKSARIKTINGDYAQSKSEWKTVLSMDRNNQLAYVGLAKAALSEEDYESALNYAKMGLDRDTYAHAFKWVRRDFVADNFLWIFSLVVISLGLLSVFLIYVTKNKVSLIRNERTHIMLSTVTHPFDSFTKIQYKKMGSVLLATILLVLFYVVSVMKQTLSGFMFTDYSAADFNSFLLLLRTVGLVALWCITNWAVCTLMGGIGRLREIFIVVCYSLIPIICGGILYIIFSNTLLPSEIGFMNLINNISFLYTGFMLTVGSIKIHDFSFGKFLLTSLLTFIGMLIVIFMLAVIVIFVQQVGAFLVTLIMELVYR